MQLKWLPVRLRTRRRVLPRFGSRKAGDEEPECNCEPMSPDDTHTINTSIISIIQTITQNSIIEGVDKHFCHPTSRTQNALSKIDSVTRDC